MLRNILAFACFALGLQAQVQVSGPSRLGQTDTWVVSFRWTAASDGTVPTTQAPSQAVQGFRIAQVEIQPLTPAPTTNYNVQINDTAGVDVLAGQANSLSSTASYNYSVGSSAVFGNFSLAVGGNLVSGAKGAVFVYLNNAPSSFVLPTSTSSSATSTTSTGPFVRADLYNFAAQTPGGSISGASTVTMRPCPAGVAGADTNHYLYISGGSGTAEAVLITGGTCTSSAAVGTLTFTPANSHSGAWSIRSASSGIQEAILAFPSALVVVDSASYDLYAKVTLPVTSPGLLGTGFLNTRLLAHFTVGDIFVVGGAGSTVTFSNLWIVPSSGIMTSGAAIDTVTGCDLALVNVFLGAPGGTGDVYIGVHAIGRISTDNVDIIAFYRGIEAVSSFLQLNTLHIYGDSTISNFLANSCALYLRGIAGGFVSNFMHDQGVYEDGIRFDPSAASNVNEIALSNIYLDNWADFGINVLPGGVSVHIELTNFRIQDDNPFFARVFGAYGIRLPVGAQNWQISNGSIGMGYGSSILIQGAQFVTVSNVNMYPSGPLIAPYGPAFQIDNTGSPKQIRVTGSTMGSGVDLGSAQFPLYGVFSNGTVDGLTLMGNTIQGSTAAVALGGSETNFFISNNSGVDTVIPSVASGATITAPILPFATTFKITGTTTVTAINGFMTGRTIRVLYPVGAGITVMGRVLAAGQSVTLTSDGVSNATWY